MSELFRTAANLDATAELSIQPVFTRPGEATVLSKFEMPAGMMDPDTAYQIVHDSAMLDGNSRLNLATFGAAWFAMPLVINLGFLVATMRILDKKRWLVIEGVRATLFLALVLTVAHGVFWLGLDWIPAKVS